MSTLRLTTISNQSGSASVPSDTVINGSAKAWVNFNGTGTVAIRASFNVSSITDNGTGNYTVNFTNSVADVNYSTLITASDSNTSGIYSGGVAARVPTVGALAVSSVQVFTGYQNSSSGSALQDQAYINVSVFR